MIVSIERPQNLHETFTLDFPISNHRFRGRDSLWRVASMATRIGRSSNPLRGSIPANHTPVFARTPEIKRTITFPRSFYRRYRKKQTRVVRIPIRLNRVRALSDYASRVASAVAPLIPPGARFLNTFDKYNRSTWGVRKVYVKCT